MKVMAGRFYVEEDDSVWILFRELHYVPEGDEASGNGKTQEREDRDGQTLPLRRIHPLQIIKALKKGSDYAEYWPTPALAERMVAALNAAFPDEEVTAAAGLWGHWPGLGGAEG